MNLNNCEYVNSACTIAATAIGEALKNRNNKGSIKITYANGRRDIDLRRYSQGLSFKISKGGDIDIVFSEFCHDDKIIRCLDFDSDETKQSENLAEFQTITTILMQDFCAENMDWHIVLDFLWEMKEGDDWKMLYERARII